MAAIAADVQRYRKTPEGHVEYFIKVVYKGKEWAIRKRYNDFSTFERLLRKNGGIEVSCKIPPKVWWDKFNHDTLAWRQKEMQKFLNILLQTTNPSESSLLREFLEVDINHLVKIRSLTFRGLRKEDRLRRIVETFAASIIPIQTSRQRRGDNNHRTYAISNNSPVSSSSSSSSSSSDDGGGDDVGGSSSASDGGIEESRSGDLVLLPYQLTLPPTDTYRARAAWTRNPEKGRGVVDQDRGVNGDGVVKLPLFQRTQYSGDGSLPSHRLGTRFDDSVIISLPCPIVTVAPDFFCLSRSAFDRLL